MHESFKREYVIGVKKISSLVLLGANTGDEMGAIIAPVFEAIAPNLEFMAEEDPEGTRDMIVKLRDECDRILSFYGKD